MASSHKVSDKLQSGRKTLRPEKDKYFGNVPVVATLTPAWKNRVKIYEPRVSYLQQKISIN